MGRRKGVYVRFRLPYPEHPRLTEGQLAAQEKIREAGRLTKERCTGLRGAEFTTCRVQAAKDAFSATEESNGPSAASSRPRNLSLPRVPASPAGGP